MICRFNITQEKGKVVADSPGRKGNATYCSDIQSSLVTKLEEFNVQVVSHQKPNVQLSAHILSCLTVNTYLTVLYIRGYSSELENCP